MARTTAAAIAPKEDILAPLIGQRIAVFTNAGAAEHRDEGVLEAHEAHILRLLTHNGPLWIPIHNVRLIEPLFSISGSASGTSDAIV